MLKASQKSQFNKLIKQNALLGAKLPLRSITSNSVFIDNSSRTRQMKSQLDNYAIYERHIGVFRMNKEHRYNTLSTSYIKDLKRFLTTLNQDDEVKIILMSPEKEQSFSNGTDFRTLHHYKKEQNHDKVTEYLKDLYSLQTLTAKINKPIIAVAHGQALNSGATFLQATGMPTSAPNTKIAFNEVQFGFVPHAGSSYYLSRLPGELGTYLALTGLPLTGVDARVLGMTDMYVHTARQYKYKLLDIFDNIEFPMPTGFDYAGHKEKVPSHTKTQHKIEHFDQMREKELIDEATRKQHKNIYFSEFAEPRDRMPETAGEADMRYQMEMLKFDRAQDTYKNRNFGYFDTKLKFYQNYFSYIKDYVREYSYFDFDEGGDTLLRHIQEIDRCFYANTLEEIIDNLKRENTAFANKCLEQMNRNSTLSMKLALRMVRQARNLDYKGTLQNEINVSLNKIQDKEFDLGVQEILMKPGKLGTSPKFNQNVSEDEVNSYFRPNKFTEAVELDIVEKALLPTREYYKEWSDQVRLWVNEESTPQSEVRVHFDVELKQALQAKGIDLRDRSIDVPTARAYLYHQNQLQRLQKHVNQRMDQMATDSKLREGYYERVHDEIQKIEKQPKEFYQMVNKHIETIFENAYIEKLQQLFQKNKEIHDLEKRRMYLRFKKFLMSSRLITFYDDKLDKLFKRHTAMPYKEPHLSEQWEDSFLLQQHPEIETSVIHHISKVIGKRTIAPLEIAKQYLSDPKLAQQMTVLTFDQEELEKLRRDILENPLKYEKMLRTEKANESYSHFPDRWKPQKIKDDAWIYWYRILNDGKSPFDNIHMWKNYQIFKEFVDNIEKKALGTLELCVTRLILDFENNEDTGNKITEFGPKDKETKRQHLMRLMGTLSEVNYKDKDRKMIRKPKNGSDELIKTKRSLDDIQRMVNNLVKDDQQMRALLPSDEGMEKNPLVQQFKQEMNDMLLGHIEFVLLNQHDNYPVSKEVLEQRLATITNPQNKNVGRLAKLGIIDQFLSDHSAEQTIKNALQLTRTFFLHEAAAAVEQIGKKVLEAFRVEEMGAQYLMMYNLMTHHSESFEHPVVKKLLSFHCERDRQKYIDILQPTQSLSFHTKNLIHMLGDGLYDRSAVASISQKEAVLEQEVKDRLKTMKEIQKHQEETEKSYHEDIQRYRELNAKDEVDEEIIHLEMQDDPQFFTQDFTVDEINILASFDEMMAETAVDLENNVEKIMDEMKVDDWLHVIWSLQTQHEIECQRIFRFGFKQDYLDIIDFEGDLKSLMGRQDATFDSVAEFAGYAKQLSEAFKKDLHHKHNEENMATVYNYYLGQRELQDEITEQSIFEKLSEAQRNISNEGNNQQSKLKQLREKILDFKSAQEISLLKEQCKKDIEVLMKSAPVKTQKYVKTILDSNSPYIDLEKVLKDLLAKDYKNFSSLSKYVDNQILSRDLKPKQLYNKLMKDYKNLSCDVVSLAVARETINQQLPSPSKKQNDNDKDEQHEAKLKAHVMYVLDYINDQSVHIPHERRKQITVGEFMQKHQFINVQSNKFQSKQSLSDIADSIIKTKIESSLLSTLSEDNSSQDDQQIPIEWEYACYVTNPFSHHLKNKQVQEALKINQNVNDDATIEESLQAESQTPDYHDFKEYTSKIIDEITGVAFEDETKRLLLDEVLLDAYNLVRLKEEFGHLKNQYRSDLLNAYTRNDFTDEEVAEIINDYTELRFKDLQLNSKFVDAIQGPYATYYLRMLREEIAKELDIDEEIQDPSELDHKIFESVDMMLYDAESIHNMSDLSNTDAVGFDNIEERAANPEQNRKLAHQTLFDELLAEYFVQKRQQVVNINELMDKLAHKFTPDNDHILRHQKEKGEMTGTKDVNHKKHYLTQFQLIDGVAVPLAYSRLVQLQNKWGKPNIFAEQFTDLMDLDIATARALEKGKNGLGPGLASHNLEDDFSIPEYLPMYDVRRPPRDYIEHKLQSILEDVFEIRKKLEKTFTRNELYAYDRILIRHLTIENLLPRIKSQVEEDRQLITVHGQNVEHEKEGAFNQFKQVSKTENKQRENNEGIINEDALYKFLAYTAMLEKTRKQTITKRGNDEKEAYELNMFDEYYKSELWKDAKRHPRKIDESVFYEHKNIPQDNIREGYVPIEQRKEVYFEAFEKYKENKKEGYDRNKMFYVLEQYYAKTQQDLEKGDQMNQAQKAIVDYFNDTENTQFFMRNKIQ